MKRSWAVRAIAVAAVSIASCASGVAAAAVNSGVWFPPAVSIANIGWIEGTTWLTLPMSVLPAVGPTPLGGSVMPRAPMCAT